MVLEKARTGRVWTREELEALPLPPMSPKILETMMKRWMDPGHLDHLEVGDEGLWVAMHGEEIAAADPSLERVSKMVEHFGPDEILMLYLPPPSEADIIEIY
jgi:hypothetical protein